MRRCSLLVLIGVVFVFTGCGWFSGEKPVGVDADNDLEPEMPFSVKEPERYSAEVVVNTNAGGKILTSNYFVARDGSKRLETFSIGRDDEFSILVTERRESFRLFPKTKQYEGLKNSGLAGSGGSLEKSVTNRWLNADKPVSFIELAKENGLKRYRAEVKDSKDTEFIIFIDEKLDYPVKQEIWSLKDEKRDLLYSMELRNISNTPPKSLFMIPGDYTIKPPSKGDEP